MGRITHLMKRALEIIFSPRKIEVPVSVKEFVPTPMLKGEFMKERTVLITGRTQGIGFGIAKAVLENDGNVIITGRFQDRVNEACTVLRKTLSDSDKRIFGIEMDNTDLDAIPSKFAQITEMIFPLKISALVNNAGIGGGGYGYTTPQEFKKIMDTNLTGAIFLTEQVARYFIKNDIHGNILNITSASDLRPATSAYQMSKWGLRSFTMGAAKSLIKHGIVVNALAPGPNDHRMDINHAKHPTCPAGRYASIEEIANLAVVLMSDMGRMIVGETLHATGGAGNLTLDDVEYSFE